MNIRQSFQETKPTLYLISTPIGNLEDFTFRAVNLLREVNLIYAEDTRRARILMQHYDIKTPLKSYHAHNEKGRVDEMLGALKEGQSLALISDAGTPRISDPGDVIVPAVIDAGYPVVPIPGASALLSALMGARQDVQAFTFLGFLPLQNKARKTLLSRFKETPETLVFYEAPHRILATLKALYEAFGSRQVTLAKELTKKFETFYDFTLQETIEIPEIRGEYVIIIEGAKAMIPLTQEDMLEHVQLLIEDGYSEMDAIKEVANIRKLKKNVVYMAFQQHKQSSTEEGS